MVIGAISGSQLLSSIKELKARDFLTAGEEGFVKMSPRQTSQERVVTIQLFRKALYEVYGKERVERHCDVGPQLDLMQRKGRALSKHAIVKMVMHLADLNLYEVTRAFHNYKAIQKVADACLSSPNESPTEENPLWKLVVKDEDFFTRLNQANLNLEELERVNSLEELSREEFEKFLEVLSPIQDLHSFLGCHKKEFRSAAAQKWSKLSYSRDLGSWMGLKSAVPYDRIKRQQEIRMRNLPSLEQGDLSYSERWEHYTEEMAKELAYLDMQEGALIEAPPSATGQYQSYKVLKLCAVGSGMVAYVLGRSHPSMEDLPPMVLMRGTAFSPSGLDMLSNLIADLEPNLGKHAYQSGKEGLFQTLRTIVTEQDKTILVPGHSLGGVLAERFVHDFIKRKSEGTLPMELDGITNLKMALFNSPGIEKSVVDENRRNLGLLPEVTIEGRHYRTVGDFVHTAGRYHLGYACNREQFPYEVITCSGLKIVPHQERFFKEKKHPIENRQITRVSSLNDPARVDELLRNHGCSWAECVRRTVGYLLYCLFKIIRAITRALFRWRGELVQANQRDLEALTKSSEAHLMQIHVIVEFIKALQIPEESDRSEAFQQWMEETIEKSLAGKSAQEREDIVNHLRAQEPRALLHTLLFQKLDQRLIGISIEEFTNRIDLDGVITDREIDIQNVLSSIPFEPTG